MKEESARLIRKTEPDFVTLTSLKGAMAAFDIDVSPFDNSNTNNVLVSISYKDCDGFYPIFAYLFQEEYLVNHEFQGKQHSQKDTPAFLRDRLGGDGSQGTG